MISSSSSNCGIGRAILDLFSAPDVIPAFDKFKFAAAFSLDKEVEDRLRENRREKRRSLDGGEVNGETGSLPESFLSSSRLRLRHLFRIDLAVSNARKLVTRLEIQHNKNKIRLE